MRFSENKMIGKSYIEEGKDRRTIRICFDTIKKCINREAYFVMKVKKREYEKKG